MNFKKTQCFLCIVLSIGIFLSGIPLSFAADTVRNDLVDIKEYTEITGTDFQDGNLWGFTAGGGTTATVAEDVYSNKYLVTTGSGNGGRSITKTLDVATEDELIYTTFDWKPGDVSTAANSSEILFSDSSDTPIFRIVKAGGTAGAIQYGVGTTGADLLTNVAITGVKTDNSWLTVNLLIDFTKQTASLKVCNKGETTGFEALDIPLNSNDFTIKKIAVNGNRASGQSLSFETQLDNFYIYGKEVIPTEPVNIVSVNTYGNELNLQTGMAKEDVISKLPTKLEVKLENNVNISLNVTWDCAEYSADVAGEYSFIGTFVIDDSSYIKNGNSIQATIIVKTTEAAPIPNIEGYTYLLGTSFEDLDLWGLSGRANPVIASDGNYLKAGVTGQSGGRSATKTFETPINDSKSIFQFDWRPGDVSTAANSSEILFSDASGNPIFRIVKVGGTNGAIQYGVGTTGTDLSTNVAVTGVSTDVQWLSVDVRFDFEKGEVSFSITDRDDPTKNFEKSGISLIDVNYKNEIGVMSINGNRASGQALTFETSIDNILIYGSGTPAPEPAVKKIISIETDYNQSYIVPVGSSKQDIVSLFPTSFQVLLDNGGTRTIPITWDCVDYDANKTGIYTFGSTFSLDKLVAVCNSDNIKGVVNVEVVSGETAPEIDGFVNQYYTTFGDVVAVTPANWGFTTSSAELSINTETIAGNETPKLQFTITNQSGGRVATKILDPAPKGDIILLKFNWFPGSLNDKGTNPNENGGDFRIEDSSKNTVFTINNTKNSPLKFFAGAQAATDTAFTNPDTWYYVELRFDIMQNNLVFKITDSGTNETKTYDISLEGISFDGSINNVKLAGVRTSGNNITWTSYLDDFGIYIVPPPENRISYVEKMPYHRVYVGETTMDISSIGLPDEVPVILVNGEKVNIPVTKWTEVDTKWDPAKAGVYTFTSTLTVPAEYDNFYNRTSTLYVYNRLPVPVNTRQAEWLDRSVIALTSGDGIFVSWRLRADEYDRDIKFNIYRNGTKLNTNPLSVTNFTDSAGNPGDKYLIETLWSKRVIQTDEAIAIDKNYISIPVQKPLDGTNRINETYTYSINDASVGDLDGDGEYEIIVKWYPSNAIDSSQSALTGPTIFDAYKLDGTLLWRMDMGLNLTSGAHYNQFLVYDFDGDGKSEMFIKTADGTTVYGTTDGVVDSNNIICQIGIPEDNGKYCNDAGHIFEGPEYISIFEGATGQVLDTIDYEFPVDGNSIAWGDTFHNRSDRFLATVAYLDGETPSALLCRGYYEKTTFVAYNFVDGKLETQWIFDSDVDGKQYMGLGNHNLSVADVDNDGCDEIIAGSLTLDQDGSVLYAMDGLMNREKGSHGDAMHVGKFDPDLEGIQVYGVHENTDVASMQYRDGATGETFISYYASKDTGRGVAANITSDPGYEFWAAADFVDVEKGAGLYNVKGEVLEDDWRALGLSANFALYWDGDLHHELLDNISITKYNEENKNCDTLIEFVGCASNNGTKATPTLQGDILGDWREEVIMRTEDSSQLRIYSTTIPTEYRLYTLMHDPIYRLGIAWQNTAYNQPPHISFYLGEDIRDEVLAAELKTPNVYYTENIAPSAPKNLRLTDISKSTATLSWDQASDNVLVKGYEVYANGAYKGTTSNLSFKITGLSSRTKYTFTVIAYDISRNRSEVATISGTTSSSTSSSSGSSSSAKPTATPSPVPTASPAQLVNVSESVFDASTGEASVVIDNNALKSAFEKAFVDENSVKIVVVEVPESPDASSYAIGIDASALTKPGSKEKIKLNTALATVEVPGNMLSNSYISSAGEVSLKIQKANIDHLSEDVKNAIGKRPIIELGLSLNGKPIEYNNPNASVSVSIPYTPTEEEMNYPENIVVWYIDGFGNAVSVPTGRYDPETGMVTFKTNHFSTFAVVYSFKTFEDLDGYDWVRKEIEVLAAKGIIKGTSDTTYKPGENLTRADFTLLLVRALGLNTQVMSNFIDVHSTDYFYDGMGIAKAMGIVKGIGNNTGNPREPITRQEMMVMAARALRLNNSLTEGTVEDLDGIADKDDIADYAVQDLASLVKSEIIPEQEDNIVHPAEQATRAEAAKLLYRIYNQHTNN